MQYQNKQIVISEDSSNEEESFASSVMLKSPKSNVIKNEV